MLPPELWPLFPLENTHFLSPLLGRWWREEFFQREPPTGRTNGAYLYASYIEAGTTLWLYFLDE